MCQHTNQNFFNTNTVYFIFFLEWYFSAFSFFFSHTFSWLYLWKMIKQFLGESFDPAGFQVDWSLLSGGGVFVHSEQLTFRDVGGREFCDEQWSVRNC